MSAPAYESLRAPPLEAGRRPVFIAIRWGAILAGVMVGISVQLALTLFGIASGLSPDARPTTSSAALLWAAFAMLVAAFVAGYIAARMSGFKRRADGLLHGAVSWAVATILFTVFATSGGGGLMSGVLNGLTQRESNMASAMTNESELTMDADSLRRFQNAIRQGDRETAIVQLIMSTGMDRLRAEGIVDQALSLMGTGGQRRNGGVMDTTAWIVFGAVALALVCGMLGGAWGAAGARRNNWTGKRRLAYVEAVHNADGNEDPGA